MLDTCKSLGGSGQSVGENRERLERRSICMGKVLDTSYKVLGSQRKGTK